MSSGSPEGGPGRYRLNLALLVAGVSLVSLWFYRHLYPFFEAVTLAGGTVSLWGVWKFVQSLLGWGAGEQADSWARRRLGGSGATELLLFSLVPIAVLYLTTASIYLEYDPDDSGASYFEVEVLHDGRPYLELEPVSSSRRLRGRPYFLRWHPVELELRIRTPFGYRSLDGELSPGRSLSVAVPSAFDRVPLIRLVPGMKLFPALPSPDDETDARFSLTLRAASGEEKGKLADLRKGTVYTGAEQDALGALIASQDDEAFRVDLKDHLVEAGLTNEVFQTRMITQIAGEKGRQLLPTGDLEPGTRIRVVGRSTLEGRCASFGAEFEVPAAGTKTVFLDCR